MNPDEPRGVTNPLLFRPRHLHPYRKIFRDPFADLCTTEPSILEFKKCAPKLRSREKVCSIQVN